MFNEGINFTLIDILKTTLLLKNGPTVSGSQFFHVNFEKNSKYEVQSNDTSYNTRLEENMKHPFELNTYGGYLHARQTR